MCRFSNETANLLPIRVANVANVSRWTDPIEDSVPAGCRRPNDPHSPPVSGTNHVALGGQKDAGKILAILITLEVFVPSPSCFRQLLAHDPRHVLHVEVFAHLPQKPPSRRKVLEGR